jgi:hypothetical protein
MTTPTEAALARNDRYVREFVEALHLCPYAKQCREAGKLHRRVLFSAEEAPAAIGEIEALPEASVEVALLIFPQARAGSPEAAQEFVSFCAGLRSQMRAFYCVAFHPDLPRDLYDAHRAVQFIRRSPDPTLQMVRASVLREVRGPSDGGTRVVNAASMTLEQLMAIHSPLSLADRIADANLATLRREGPDRLDAFLSSLKSS